MKKILIVEDEKPITHALSRVLGTQSYSIFTAITGTDGLELAKETHPDLIIMDVMLPGKNGIEVLEELRKDDWGKDANVIILSNLTDAEKTARARDLNVLDYIVKSDIPLVELAQRIEKYTAN